MRLMYISTAIIPAAIHGNNTTEHTVKNQTLLSFLPKNEDKQSCISQICIFSNSYSVFCGFSKLFIFVHT